MSSLASIIRAGLLWHAVLPEDDSSLKYKEQQKAIPKEQYHALNRDECSNLHELCLEQYKPVEAQACVSFGIDSVDSALPTPGLSSGTIHEWSLLNSINEKNHTPHSLFSWIALRSWREFRKAAGENLRFIFWIGRESWPSPHTLGQISLGDPDRASFFKQNIFIDVNGEKERLWSIETALRSPASALVIAPLSTTSLSVSRRLMLAAEKGNSIGLFSISNRMREISTTAQSRWEVSPVSSTSDYARWKLDVVKWRGGHPRQNSWEVELSPGSVRDIYFSEKKEEQKLKIRGEQHDYKTSEAFSLHIPADVAARALQEEIARSQPLHTEQRQSG